MTTDETRHFHHTVCASLFFGIIIGIIITHAYQEYKAHQRRTAIVHAIDAFISK